MGRCGYSRRTVVNALKAVRGWVTTNAAPVVTGSRTVSDEAAHIITLWHMSPGYVDGTGEPIPLPVSGPAPSIEALVRRADRNLTLDSAMDYLRRTKAVRKIGVKFVPRSRQVLHQTGTLTQAQHHLRVVTGLMLTAKHNSRAPFSQRWVEAVADGVISRARSRAFQREFQAIGIELLKSADTLMVRDQRAKRSGASHIPMSIGVYVFEGPPLTAGGRLIRPKAQTPRSGASTRNAR